MNENERKANMKYKMSTKAKTIWRIRLTLAAILLSVLTGGIFAVSAPVGTIVAVIWLTVYFFGIILYVPLAYRACSFDINNDFLTVKKGIILNKYIVVNIDRVLYIEFFQSPLQRKMKVCSIIVHTAGSLIFIGQLEPEVASHIRFVIKNSKEQKTQQL